MATISLTGPARTIPFAALLDTGADETVFPASDAARVGLDLSGADVGEFQGVGGSMVRVQYAAVVLRMSDGREFREWPARVAFARTPMRLPLLGIAGCLQYFTATFHGDLEEVELVVNGTYPGT
jgi:Aspartyl protease